MSGINLQSFWGNFKFDSAVVEASGRSGGILSMWDPNIFLMSKVVKNRNFLLVSGFLKGQDSILHILNVYAPQCLRAKQLLWEEIRLLKMSNPGVWIMFGDFNAVRMPEDRRNSIFNPVESGHFNDFIYSAGLSEFAMKGRRFTFCKGKGSNVKLSKIDRFLICHNLIELWSDACLTALPRFLSDHSPIILATDPIDYGPLPFRVFNSWLDRPGFEEIVKNASDSFSFFGSPDLYLANKLKHIKAHLKRWWTVTKEKEAEVFNNFTSELQYIDGIMENRDLLEEELWIHAECKVGLSELSDSKSKDLKQMSRVKWASYGDDNSSFFHGIIKSKEAKNRIHGMVINGAWSNNPKLIKREACKFSANGLKRL
ncbi:uncharacterized protein LOC143536489 [Bidens hawaiensis]|uniref:uncharacterized protein LOC143536489 n=1 Tax=Bidens hawaiensis TaxID=980011 RepID=UPI00404ACA98